MTKSDNSTDELQKVISRTAFLLERLQEDVSRLGESVDGTNQTVTRLEQKLENVAELAGDIPVIKAAVIGQTKENVAQDERISHLEAVTP